MYDDKLLLFDFLPLSKMYFSIGMENLICSPLISKCEFFLKSFR
jgi:hypothetical protein